MPEASRHGSGRRLRDVDALRGLALFGIVMVNVWAFASAYYGRGVSDPALDDPLGRAVQFAVSLLFETKFYLLFSFLFGYSFTLQLAAAERAEASFRARMVRRHLALLAIGVVHGALLFHGDILITYALLGLLLLGLRGLSPRRAVGIALSLIALAGTAWLLLGIGAHLEGITTDSGTIHRQAAETTAAWRDSAATVAAEHTRQLPEALAFIVLAQGPSAFAMFLIGFAAGRRRVLEDVAAIRPRLVRVAWVGLPLGLTGSAAYAAATVFRPGSAAELLAFGLDLLTAPLLAAGYVASALLAFQTRTARGLPRRSRRQGAARSRTTSCNRSLSGSSSPPTASG